MGTRLVILNGGRDSRRFKRNWRFERRLQRPAISTQAPIQLFDRTGLRIPEKLIVKDRTAAQGNERTKEGQTQEY
jgi:hypothetical protein